MEIRRRRLAAENSHEGRKVKQSFRPNRISPDNVLAKKITRAFSASEACAEAPALTNVLILFSVAPRLEGVLLHDPI